MRFTDRLTVDASSLRRTKDGYAVVDARVARAGNVQDYYGFELGEPDRETIRVYRPEAEVFKRDAIASYTGVPVTLGHPTSHVTADSWKDLAVGETGEDVLRDGEFVRVPLMLRDSTAIKAVEDGIRELSMGYDAKITFADGISPSGERFDAIMSDFRMNHVALVKFARGGSELRIGDGWGAAPVDARGETDVQRIKRQQAYAKKKAGGGGGNPYHQPAGSSKGGEFAPKAGGSGGGTLTKEPKKQAEEVRSELLGAFGSGGNTDMDPNGPGFSFGIRNFGRWENPPDARDDEDYDWQQPTKETMEKIKTKVDAIQKKFPDVKIQWNVGEKNYIDFFLLPAGNVAKKKDAVPWFTTQGKDAIMDLKKILVDGLEVETTDAGARAINKLLGDLRSSAAKIDELNTAHATALAAKDAVIAAKDKELATKDAELDATKAKIISDADLDKRVQARADLVNTAKAIAKDVKTEGLSDAAIRKAVVVAVLGDGAVKDKAEAYIDARFEILAEEAAKNNNDGGGGGGGNDNDAFRNVRRDASAVADAEKARLDAEKREREAWKTKAA